MEKYITVNKTNHQTAKVLIDDIIRFTEDKGVYFNSNDDRVEYNTELWCKDKTHYITDTPDEIKAKIDDALNK